MPWWAPTLWGLRRPKDPAPCSLVMYRFSGTSYLVLVAWAKKWTPLLLWGGLASDWCTLGAKMGEMEEMGQAIGGVRENPKWAST